MPAYSPIEVFAFCSDISHAIARLALALSTRGLFLSCTHDDKEPSLRRIRRRRRERWHRVSGEERGKDFVKRRRVRKKKEERPGLVVHGPITENCRPADNSNTQQHTTECCVEQSSSTHYPSCYIRTLQLLLLQ